MTVPYDELHFQCAHASGPGGQGVNTSDSAVLLRWNLRDSAALPEDIKARLIQLCGKRLTSDGELLLEASEFRSQYLNRQAALERLEAWIARASTPPKPRRKTRVPNAQKRKRREDKARRSQRLQNRKPTED